MNTETEKIFFKGSHPDSLYRVSGGGGAGADKMSRAVRVLRWPAVLVIICAALAGFVYYLMPENMNLTSGDGNSTVWALRQAGAGAQLKSHVKSTTPVAASSTTTASTTHKKTGKTPEIDFYNVEEENNNNLISILDTIAEKTRPPVLPVFPSHLVPEVQYGNERAEKDNLRAPKLIEETDKDAVDSTLRPHITQKPEKPLAIYFNDIVTTTRESITRAETVNDFTTVDDKSERNPSIKHHQKIWAAGGVPYIVPVEDDVKFTSGHSKFFGIGIEDAAKMKSTTQSSVYNTRVSPTLPSWRERDDATTKKYPINANADVPQCHSPRTDICRGILPYDLAGAPVTFDGEDVTSFLPQFEYLVSTNCSERLRHFVCSLLEPECSPEASPPPKPCYSMCRDIVNLCESYLPHDLLQVFQCKRYHTSDCIGARAPCYGQEFPCDDGSCVLRDNLCDGTRDCPTGEDEELCMRCKNNEFRCPTGGCIQNQWVCDGYHDCPDGEDEDAMICDPRLPTTTRPSSTMVQAPEDEPGEALAGSAPAPAIRRPAGRKQHLQRGGQPTSNKLAGESESSQELLMTSDTSNGLRRNFTRQPSPSRLIPYAPKRSRVETATLEPQLSTQKPPRMSNNVRKIAGRTTDFNDAEIAMPNEKSLDNKEYVEMTHLDKKPNTDRKDFQKEIDGAALLKQAAEEDEADEAAAKNAKAEDPAEDYGPGAPATSHSSPSCPGDELRCVDGRCITLAQLCDGTIDCSDHADEDNCYT